MYSNKFAAKLMNIRRLCKENVRNLSIFMVLSTHYPTFRISSYFPGLQLLALLSQHFTAARRDTYSLVLSASPHIPCGASL